MLIRLLNYILPRYYVVFREVLYTFRRCLKLPVVFVIGDSHTGAFQSLSPFIVYHLGPSTAFSAFRVSSQTGSRSKILNILSRFKKGDQLVLVFGEIDCRVHVHNLFVKEGKKKEYNDYIKSSINSYWKLMEYLNSVSITPIILGIPPANKQENVYGIEFYASPAQQLEIKKAYNKLLLAKAAESNLLYMSLMDVFSGQDGFIDEKSTPDGVHLGRIAGKYVKSKLVSA